jgi:hypothetical protein
MDNIINNNDMDKEQLETNLAALKLLQQETNEKLTDYKVQVSLIEKELEDFNKPALTPEQFDGITCAIESAVEEFDFTDTDNFELEYGIDYDGRVHCESHEFRNNEDLVEMICNRVYKLFAEAECPEDDNSQLNTQTVAEKIV